MLSYFNPLSRNLPFLSLIPNLAAKALAETIEEVSGDPLSKISSVATQSCYISLSFVALSESFKTIVANLPQDRVMPGTKYWKPALVITGACILGLGVCNTIQGGMILKDELTTTTIASISQFASAIFNELGIVFSGASLAFSGKTIIKSALAIKTEQPRCLV